MIYILGTRGIPARYGGFETLAEHLHESLLHSGIDVRVVGTRDPEITATVWGKIIRLRIFRHLETPVLTWISKPKMEKSDSVLIVNPINVWTAKRLSKSGNQVWLHMDGMEHLRGKWGFIARFAHRLARSSSENSGLNLVIDSRALLKSISPSLETRVEYVGYGGCPTAEKDPSHRWKPTSGEQFFLVVARPEPENQIWEICLAFASVKQDARLVIVGEPPVKTNYWRKVLAVADCDERIHLLGSIWDKHRLCNLYRTCLAVVHGHSVGGTNPSLVHAHSHGCPVLAHDNPFNRETLENNGAFWNSTVDLGSLMIECLLEGSTKFVPAHPPNWTWRLTTNAYAKILGARTQI